MASSFILAVGIYIWSIYFADVYNYRMLFKLNKIEGIPVLLLLPIFYFGFKSSIGEQTFSWKDYLWLLPSVFMVGSIILSYSIMGEDLAVDYIRDIIEHRESKISFTDPIHQRHYLISGRIYGMLVLIQIAYLITCVTLHLIRRSNWYNKYYPNTENKSIKHQYVLLIGFYIILLLSLMTYLERFQTTRSPMYIQIFMAIWAIVIYFMGLNTNKLNMADSFIIYQGQRGVRDIGRQGYIAKEDMEADKRKKIPQKLLLQLNHLINEEQIFLQYDLRLEDVARMLRTNRTYISRLINNEFHCSFSEYINRKRIEHAQKLMQANQDMSQEQIAECSGFQRANTFGRTFKQQVGMTFREWQNINSHIHYSSKLQEFKKKENNNNG